MTGPEHYREAERLVGDAHHWSYGDGNDPAVGAALAAEAQVHATLALAAATALTDPEAETGPEWAVRWSGYAEDELQPGHSEHTARIAVATHPDVATLWRRTWTAGPWQEVQPDDY